MKIAAYAIALNEHANVPDWRASTADADISLIVDTGSTDGTAELADAHIAIRPFRFDDARNAALALVPADVDICVALDLDERLSDGWRSELERAWAPGTTKAHYPYIWRRLEGGSPDMFYNHRIHARHGYRWKYPTHEHIYPNMMREERIVAIPALIIEQTQDITKPRPNDLELLAWGEWENPNDTRMLHYYGRELMWRGYPRDAIERFERYLELEPERPFPDERAKTLEYMLQCRESLKEAA